MSSRTPLQIQARNNCVSVLACFGLFTKALRVFVQSFILQTNRQSDPFLLSQVFV